MAPEGRRAQPRVDEAPMRRLKAVGLSSLAVLAIAGMTVVFTNASGTRSIAADSAILHWSNVTSGAAAVTRAAVNQAMIFAIDERVGVSSPDSTAIAVAEAGAAVDTLRELTTRVPTVLVPTGRDVVELIATAETITSALVDEDTDAAMALFAQEFEPAYASISADLSEAQIHYAARIAEAESGAARVEIAIRWLVTLLIPGLAVVLYRAIVRRRYRRSEIEFEAKLQAERRLSVAKDDFVAAVSHELRTPLTSIVGYSDILLERGFEDPDEARELVELINTDSEELTRLVEDLLAAPRVDGEGIAVHPSPTDLRTEAERIAGRLERGGKTVSLVGDAPRVWADASRVRQILRSLLSNAVRYGRPPISMRITSTERTATLTVIDAGSGVPGHIVDRLFEPFVHGSREAIRTGSVGLGLAIAKSLASAMDGDMTYERSGGESRFSLTLPLSENDRTRAGSATHPATGSRARADVR